MKEFRFIGKCATAVQGRGPLVYSAMVCLGFILVLGGFLAQDAPPFVVNWTSPESGWLYVVDQNIGSDTTTYVHLVDPTKKVMGTLRVGYHPDLYRRKPAIMRFAATSSASDNERHSAARIPG
jgi:hypothetical protein